MKLFYPGPVEVSPEILAEMARPQIPHRGSEFTALFTRVTDKMKKVLDTNHDVFISTSSGSGLWEAAARCCIRRKVLCCACGAFGERWADVCAANGKEAVTLSVEWGQPNLPEAVDDALRKGDFDAVTYVHNETSTGLANPLGQLGEVMKNHPDVLLLVDAVSSMGGTPIKFEDWQIDVAVASSQKAFALPPGIAFAVVSPRALARAAEIKNRGYYFDLLNFKKNAEKGQTPTTPSIPHIYALDRQLDRMLAEGMEKRFARHRQMAAFVRDWARRRFALFPAEGYESDTVTCIRNTRGISVAALNDELKKRRNCIISNGYAKLKEVTFRIAHMGDLQLADLQQLVTWIDEITG
jgi:predicted phosphoserine aminotransferase